MHAFAARFTVFVCAIAVLAASVVVAEGQLWLGFTIIAAATSGAVVATAYVPRDRFIFGALFAMFAFGSVSGYEPLSGGITSRHVAAVFVAAAVISAFVAVAPRLRKTAFLPRA